MLKKDTLSDNFDIVCAAIVRYRNQSTTNPLPKELVNFRNVPCSSHVHDISVNETSIETGGKNIKLSTEFKDGKSGVVKINNQ